MIDLVQSLPFPAYFDRRCRLDSSPTFAKVGFEKMWLAVPRSTAWKRTRYEGASWKGAAIPASPCACRVGAAYLHGVVTHPEAIEKLNHT